MKNSLMAVFAVLRAAPARMRAMFAIIAAVALGGLASAQTSSNYALDLTTPITSFGTAMTTTITSNSPALFGILALSVGFFFLWGRVRALF